MPFGRAHFFNELLTRHHAIRLCSLPQLRQARLRGRQALPELPRPDIVAQPPAVARFRSLDPGDGRNHHGLCRTALSFIGDDVPLAVEG